MYKYKFLIKFKKNLMKIYRDLETRKKNIIKNKVS